MGRHGRSGGRWGGAARAAVFLLPALAAAACGGEAAPPADPATAAAARPADPMSQPRPPETVVDARPAPAPPALAAVAATPRRADLVPVAAAEPPEPRRFAALPAPPAATALVYTPVAAWSFGAGLPDDWRFGSATRPLPVAALLTAPPGALTVVADRAPAAGDALTLGVSTVVPAATVEGLAGQSVEIAVRLSGPSGETPLLVGALAIEAGNRTPWRPLVRAPDGTESLRWTLPLTIGGGMVIALAPAAGSAAITDVSLSVGAPAAP